MFFSILLLHCLGVSLLCDTPKRALQLLLLKLMIHYLFILFSGCFSLVIQLVLTNNHSLMHAFCLTLSGLQAFSPDFHFTLNVPGHFLRAPENETIAESFISLRFKE